MPRIVTAAFTSAIPRNAPSEIVYIPVGSNKINATVGGKPGEITVNVPVDRGQAIAASLQAALEMRLASPVRPRLAFDHQRTGPASGHPQSFSFDPARGIILATEWSNSGKAAIEGGDYGYFSPTFYIDNEGIPSGLPEKGEIGSLVDEPAFRNIGLVAASESHLHEEHQPSRPIMKLVLAHLGIDPAHESAESSAVAKIKATESELSAVKASNTTLEAEIAALKAKVEAADAAAAAAESKRKDAKVEAAIAAGKVAPKDDVARKNLRELIDASEAVFDNHVAALPVKFSALDKPVAQQTVKAGDKEVELTGHERLVAALEADMKA